MVLHLLLQPQKMIRFGDVCILPTTVITICPHRQVVPEPVREADFVPVILPCITRWNNVQLLYADNHVIARVKDDKSIASRAVWTTVGERRGLVARLRRSKRAERSGEQSSKSRQHLTTTTPLPFCFLLLQDGEGR